MSGYFEDDEDQNSGPKALREALDKANKQNKELLEKLSKLEGTVRTQSVKEILTDLGVKPKVAGLLPKDLEPTKEAIESWVKDYEDVFGSAIRSEVKTEANEAPPAPVEPAQPNVDAATQAAFGRLQSPESASGVTTPDAEQQQIAWLQAANAHAKTSEEFAAILRGDIQLPT